MTCTYSDLNNKQCNNNSVVVIVFSLLIILAALDVETRNCSRLMFDKDEDDEPYFGGGFYLPPLLQDIGLGSRCDSDVLASQMKWE